MPKLDSFIKHFGLRKCIKVKPRFVMGKIYVCPTNFHVKSDKLYAYKGQDDVVVQFVNGDKVGKIINTTICVNIPFVVIGLLANKF